MGKRFKAMRGTHDLLPDESWLWRWIETAFVDLCSRYAYQEIRVPIFESTELFERGTGFGSDVVQKEMYTFPDKKGRSLSLRPEGTPSVIRAYLEHGLSRRAKVAKLFYMGPMFRYDKPGAGRYRQFHQVGVEVIGTLSPRADAEVILLLWDYLKLIGLEDISLRLNTLGCKDCRERYSGVVRDFLEGRLGHLCEDCHDRFGRNPLRVLDCKVAGCKDVIQDAPAVDAVLDDDCVAHFGEVKRYVELAGVDFCVDAKLVRGLDYYTRTVFEVFHGATGVDNSLGGGGRYDELVQELGGASTPAVGFSAGLERVILALKAEASGGDEGTYLDVYVAYIADENFDYAFKLANELRKEFRVWLEFESRKPQKQLAAASKMGAAYTAILGEDEVKKGTVVFKHMESGEQVEVEREEAAAWLRKSLGGGTGG
jgi:histidyl-tRNA synthetase